MNKAHYEKVLEQITQHPETWNQKAWHCGSSHCFAGWAQVLSGKPANEYTVRRDARIYLDISLREADWLFAPYRTIQHLVGYDPAGYDRDGLDKDNKPHEGHP